MALRCGTVATIPEVSAHLSSGTVGNHLSSAMGKAGSRHARSSANPVDHEPLRGASARHEGSVIPPRHDRLRC